MDRNKKQLSVKLSERKRILLSITREMSGKMFGHLGP